MCTLGHLKSLVSLWFQRVGGGDSCRCFEIAFEHAFGNTGSDREAILAANKFAARNPLKTKVTQSDYTCLRIANRLAPRDELTDLLDGAVVISDE